MNTDAVRRLQQSDDVDAFSCGLASVDEWFKQSAKAQQSARRVSTHVWLEASGAIRGFFSLRHIIVSLESASKSLVKSAGGLETSALLVAQMGLRKSDQGRGNSKALMRSIFATAACAQDIAAFPLLVVDPEHDDLVPFYERFGFRSVETQKRMIVRMSVVQKALKQL